MGRVLFVVLWVLSVDARWRVRWRADRNKTITADELREAKTRLAQMCPHATKSPFYPSDEVQEDHGLAMGPFYIDDHTISTVFVNHIPKTGGTATLQYLKKTITVRLPQRDYLHAQARAYGNRPGVSCRTSYRAVTRGTRSLGRCM